MIDVVSDSSGESDSSEESDIDGEAASALFMVVVAYIFVCLGTCMCARESVKLF